MEMTRVTSVIALLIVAIAYGEALKCHQGVPGISMTEVDCAGTCITTETTTNGEKTVAVACQQTKHEGPCIEAAGSKICYCNTDLCNTGGSGGGGNKPKPSGSSALKVTWAVTCLMAIATAFGDFVC